MLMHHTACLVYIFCLMLWAGSICNPSDVFGSDGPVDYLSDDFYSEKAESKVVNDPLEPVNRIVFTFNDTMYIWVMEPVASFYSTVIPMDLRICVDNFFRNLQEPVRFVNTLLQGRFTDAFTVLQRFVINSTLGIYGLADAAGREFGIGSVEATMGETLETWGVGDGFYLVIPLLGPSTLRETVGGIVDAAEMTPYYSWSDSLVTNGAIYVGKETNNLSLHLGEYEEWKKLLFDPYVSFRNAYFQFRREARSSSRAVEFRSHAPEEIIPE